MDDVQLLKEYVQAVLEEDFFDRLKQAPARKKKRVQGFIYVLHFEKSYHHARHYIGWTTDVDARVAEHLSGQGSPLVKAVVDAGIEVTLATTMPGTRTMERHLKNRGNAYGVCPICRKAWLEKKRETERARREKRRSSAPPQGGQPGPA